MIEGSRYRAESGYESSDHQDRRQYSAKDWERKEDRCITDLMIVVSLRARAMVMGQNTLASRVM